MDFNEFEIKTIEYFKEKYGEECKIKVKDVLKNNGRIVRGITVIKGDVNACPTVYLNDMFLAYQRGEDFYDIMCEIEDIIDKASLDEMVDLSFLSSYESVKDQIVPKVINREKNADYLETIPHVDLLDLSIIFYVIIKNKKFGMGSLVINNSCFERWNITVDDMLKDAKENYERILVGTVETIEDVLIQMIKERGLSDVDTIPFLTGDRSIFKSLPMYVVSNKRRNYGAASILNEDKLKELSVKFNASFYILPSSIHELIYVPAGEVDDIEHLRSMVAEVNKTEVCDADFLSNNVYYFDAEKSALSVV